MYEICVCSLGVQLFINGKHTFLYEVVENVDQFLFDKFFIYFKFNLGVLYSSLFGDKICFIIKT